MAQVTEFIDLSDHDAFVEAVPHAAFAALRLEDPVHFNPEPDGGRGFWAVTRYEDIRHVHRHVDVFSSELGGTSLEAEFVTDEAGGVTQVMGSGRQQMRARRTSKP